MYIVEETIAMTGILGRFQAIPRIDLAILGEAHHVSRLYSVELKVK